MRRLVPVQAAKLPLPREYIAKLVSVFCRRCANSAPAKPTSFTELDARNPRISQSLSIDRRQPGKIVLV